MRKLLFIMVLSTLPLFASWQELERQVGAWRGDFLINAPARRVRCAILPFSTDGDALPLGALVNASSNQTTRLVVLFPPEKQSDSKEARIIIPDMESVKTEGGDVPLDGDIITQLLQNPYRFCKGKLDADEQAALLRMASVFQIKFRRYKLLPLFIGNETPQDMVKALAAQLMKERNTLVVAIQQETVSEETDTTVVQAAKALGFSPKLTALGTTKSMHDQKKHTVLLFQESPQQESAINQKDAPAFITQFEAKILLELARDVIASQITKSDSPLMPTFSENLSKPYGSQLELKNNGQTVGQFLTMAGKTPLANSVVLQAYKFVKDDAYHLTKEDLPNLKFTITILSIPQRIDFKTLEELYTKIKPNRDGAFLTVNGKTTGFVPIVWKQVKTPEMFVKALCAKLSVSPEDLLQPNTQFMTFETVTISE